MKEIILNSYDHFDHALCASVVLRLRKVLGYLFVSFVFIYTFSNVDSYSSLNSLNYTDIESPSLVSRTVEEKKLDFSKTVTFKTMPLHRAEEVSKREFRSMILRSIPKRLRRKFIPFLDQTLLMSQKYNIDPFWAISIMWTESHFNINAKSYVNARGLMQIMPRTGHYVADLLGWDKTFNESQKLIKDPFSNIEMGVFYLSYLAKKFNHNLTLATVAYNMGPSFVLRRLRTKRPVGVKNLYLDKVRRHYGQVTNVFKAEMKNKVRPYELTYVVRKISPNLSFYEVQNTKKPFVVAMQQQKNQQKNPQRLELPRTL